MGQKTIKVIDLSQPEAEKKTKPKASLHQAEKAEKKESKKETVKESRPVKSGKRKGRLADMSQVILKKSAGISDKAQKPSFGKRHLHSHRFSALRKMVKRDKLYSPSEAIALVKKLANARFEETVELHLVSLDTGVLGKIQLPHKTNKSKKQEKIVIKTENKFPLAHLSLGKASWTKEKLLTNLKAILGILNLPRIKKAVLTSTMSPGIKIALKGKK